MTDDDAVSAESLTHAAPDGTTLAVRLFRPKDADDPVPVLLQRTPYGAPAKLPSGSFAAMALGAGYAVAYEDTRGRGESGGAFRPWVHEGRDGASTVEWLAEQPWSTGRVGLFGRSSAGQVQLFAAAEQPTGLAAIAPMFTPSDLHRADFFQDGAMSAMTLVTWSFDWIARETAHRLERQGTLTDAHTDAVGDALDDALDDVDALVSHHPLVSLPDHVLGSVDLPADVAPSDLVPHWEPWTSRPTYDAFWRSFDPEVSYDRITVPGLHITGWYELCQQGTLTTYGALRDQASPSQHLVVGPWAHLNTSSEVGAVDFGADASADAYGLDSTRLAFFDTYVRGVPREPFADKRAGGTGQRTGEANKRTSDSGHVETFRARIDGDTGSGGGAWATHDDWPPTDSRCERWYLTSGGDAATDVDDGRLRRRRPGKFEPADTWTHDPTDPVPTHGGPLCCRDETRAAGVFDQRTVEARDDVCTYTTPPLDAGIELAGPVSATVTVATTASDTDVTAKLVHVAADGAAYNLCEGIRRLQYRHGRDRISPVTSGEPVRAVVDMWDVHYCVPANDRLRLEIASSNHPRFDPHPGTTAAWRARDEEVKTAIQTLYHERDRESVMSVTRR